MDRAVSGLKPASALLCRTSDRFPDRFARGAAALAERIGARVIGSIEEAA